MSLILILILNRFVNTGPEIYCMYRNIAFEHWTGNYQCLVHTYIQLTFTMNVFTFNNKPTVSCFPNSCLTILVTNQNLLLLHARLIRQFTNLWHITFLTDNFSYYMVVPVDVCGIACTNVCYGMLLEMILTAWIITLDRRKRLNLDPVREALNT